MRGVNYLDKNFRRHLEEPRDAIFDNDVASAIALVRKQFKDSGTQKWHRATVEWLLVHLLTEIGTTPHGDRQGYTAPTLEGSYQAILQQFVSQALSVRFNARTTNFSDDSRDVGEMSTSTAIIATNPQNSSKT